MNKVEVIRKYEEDLAIGQCFVHKYSSEVFMLMSNTKGFSLVSLGNGELFDDSMNENIESVFCGEDDKFIRVREISGGEIEMENLYGVSSTWLDLNDAVLLIDHLTKVFMLDQLSREER